MSIASVTSYRARRDGCYQRVMLSKNGVAGSAARPGSTWLNGGFPAAGAAPTTAVVPTSATTGAIGQVDSSGTQRLLRAIVSWGTQGGGLITICDRLSHQGGLDGTVTSAQTTNLPTAALTRQTSGVGVMGALEVYTAIGATGTTVTASYTNTTPTAGQVTQPTTFGGGAFGNTNGAGRMILLPLAAGDVGITKVASVTVLGTTGTAGNFGVTLFYPLVSIPFSTNALLDQDVEALFGFGTWFPKIASGACLFLMTHSSATTQNLLCADLKIGED